MAKKVLMSNFDDKTRSVKLGKQIFEIPAHMSIADMAEVWRDNSDTIETAAWAIVEFAPKFASMIVNQSAEKNGYYVIPKRDRNK
jgi:hypothetical protein